jgi:hypothetical protein
VVVTFACGDMIIDGGPGIAVVMKYGDTIWAFWLELGSER